MKYYFLAVATLVVVCVGCAMDGSQILDKDEHFAPPAAMLQRPGPMVDGPGPGVMPMMAGPQMGMPPGMMGGMPGGMPMGPVPARVTQLKFLEPKGMSIGWQVGGGFAEEQLIAPNVYDFRQGAVYRLKLTKIPGHDDLTIYPTLEVYPSHLTTESYLAHNAIPLELTGEDLDQVEANNFVTKVIYLPDPKYQDLAIADVATIVSTRLDPGVDPVAEADRRGTIMVVLRMGNKNIESKGGAGGANNGAMLHGGVLHVGHRVISGENGQYEGPMPIGRAGSAGPIRVPSAMIMGGGGLPGHPPMHPIAGRGPIGKWGMPMTGTPIGLPGPPHLPFGGPAGLKSHTIRNRTKQRIPGPVPHFLIDVEHSPGYSLPKPAHRIEYKEKHPVYKPGEASWPANRMMPH